MEKEKGSCGITPAAGACSTTPAKGSCGTATAAGACSTGKQKCCGKLLLSAIAGGIVMFAWISISWMLLPLHKGEISGFKNEKAVATVLGQNITGDGIYALPAPSMDKAPAKSAGKEKKSKVAAAKPAAAAKPVPNVKPYAYVVVKADGIDVAGSVKPALAREFILCLFLAGLLGCILKKTGGCCCPVGLSFKIGLIAGVAGYMPNFIWFHFPLNSALVGVFETLVGFVLAGFVISKFVLDLPLGGKCATKTDCAKLACGTKTEEKK